MIRREEVRVSGPLRLRHDGVDKGAEHLIAPPEQRQAGVRGGQRLDDQAGRDPVDRAVLPLWDLVQDSVAPQLAPHLRHVRGGKQLVEIKLPGEGWPVLLNEAPHRGPETLVFGGKDWIHHRDHWQFLPTDDFGSTRRSRRTGSIPYRPDIRYFGEYLNRP